MARESTAKSSSERSRTAKKKTIAAIGGGLALLALLVVGGSAQTDPIEEDSGLAYHANVNREMVDQDDIIGGSPSVEDEEEVVKMEAEELGFEESAEDEAVRAEKLALEVMNGKGSAAGLEDEDWKVYEEANDAWEEEPKGGKEAGKGELVEDLKGGGEDVQEEADEDGERLAMTEKEMAEEENGEEDVVEKVEKEADTEVEESESAVVETESREKDTEAKVSGDLAKLNGEVAALSLTNDPGNKMEDEEDWFADVGDGPNSISKIGSTKANSSSSLLDNQTRYGDKQKFMSKDGLVGSRPETVEDKSMDEIIDRPIDNVEGELNQNLGKNQSIKENIKSLVESAKPTNFKDKDWVDQVDINEPADGRKSKKHVTNGDAENDWTDGVGSENERVASRERPEKGSITLDEDASKRESNLETEIELTEPIKSNEDDGVDGSVTKKISQSKVRKTPDLDEDEDWTEGPGSFVELRKSKGKVGEGGTSKYNDVLESNMTGNRQRLSEKPSRTMNEGNYSAGIEISVIEDKIDTNSSQGGNEEKINNVLSGKEILRQVPVNETHGSSEDSPKEADPTLKEEEDWIEDSSAESDSFVDPPNEESGSKVDKSEPELNSKQEGQKKHMKFIVGSSSSSLGGNSKNNSQASTTTQNEEETEVSEKVPRQQLVPVAKEKVALFNETDSKEVDAMAKEGSEKEMNVKPIDVTKVAEEPDWIEDSSTDVNSLFDSKQVSKTGTRDEATSSYSKLEEIEEPPHIEQANLRGARIRTKDPSKVHSNVKEPVASLTEAYDELESLEIDLGLTKSNSEAEFSSEELDAELDKFLHD